MFFFKKYLVVNISTNRYERCNADCFECLFKIVFKIFEILLQFAIDANYWKYKSKNKQETKNTS
jgi:hypothetical protein